MRVAASLSNRIFLACTLLAALSLGFAFYFVNARATDQAEAELRRGLTDAATIVDQYRGTLLDTFTRMARLLAGTQSNLMAAVTTDDPPTVQPLADEYRSEINADVVIVSNKEGRVLATAGAGGAALSLDRRVAGTPAEISTFIPSDRGILQVTSVPIAMPVPGVDDVNVLGRLTVGLLLDDARAATFKDLTGSDIAFGVDGRIVGSSVPAGERAPLAPLLGRGDGDISRVTIGGEEYLALSRPIHTATAAPEAETAADTPRVIVLRSRTERLRFLNTLRAGLGAAFIVTVILATILSYAVARTVTRPLSDVTDAMRDVAATGDLTRKVLLRSRTWDDEDARVLATAFNTLTESIAHFQREAAQKERLSSLGRLSTVVAHEIRNPLMIIRATLSTLMRDNLTVGDIREAVADIDDETKRLNRIVTEVLDFAKPIRFELVETALNDICRASVVAAWEGQPGPEVTLDLDPFMPPVVTDPERLRTVLVNVLSNARHAVDAVVPGRPGRTAILDGPGVIVKTRQQIDRAVITVADRGVGIAPGDMAHIFDPYFTTRRAGTGLGLPISKNIVEGLGGTIQVNSRVGEGTEIVIDLPLRSRGAAA
jgi:signal transduction histidine kinase